MGRSVRREFAYQTVYRYLETLISHACEGGSPRLPSLRDLARRLRVSLATVQYAYSLLEREGRVHSVPKSGYFAQVPVNEPASAPRSSTGQCAPFILPPFSAASGATVCADADRQRAAAQCAGRPPYPFFQAVLAS